MKRMLPILLLITLFAGTSVLTTAMADGHRDSGGRHGDDHDAHSGHWNYGWHDGHLGWLWVVGSALLIYDVTRPAPAPLPPVVMVQTSAPYTTPPTTPARAGYWYFCPSSGSYYPYVQTCPDGWETVPATPPPSN
jgi:hypothetical protein